MATKSIFDCDSLDARNEPQRQQVTYDDDVFEFGCEVADEIDAAPKNVSISVTFDQNGDKSRKNGKRKAHDNFELENGRVYKVVKKYVPSIKVSTNGTSRRAVEANSHTEDYDLLKEIGCGTYGRVYKARWNPTQEVIAIKRLTCKMNVPYWVIFLL